MKRIFLHIGTHKTGSTSIQRWLYENEGLLRRNGYGLFSSQHTRDNHVELYLAAMRYERDSFAKQSMPQVEFDRNYTSMVSQRVQSFLAEEEQDKVIFTSEGLSLLRHEDELERLGEIIGSDSSSVTVILMLRNRDDYLDSYRGQLLRKKNRKPSADYWSALYVEDNTWLNDYDALISAYQRKFGDNAVHVIDYDEEVKVRGNIIPAFLEAIGLDSCVVDKSAYDSYRLNRTPGFQGRRRLWNVLMSALKKRKVRS